MEHNSLQSIKAFARRQSQFWKMNNIYKDAPALYSATVP